MKKIIILLSALFSISIFNSCDNTLNLNTDWEETTVVYTFLDRNDSISYIKVNKAFLGNDNVMVMAGIRDSSEYQNISVTLEKYFNNKHIKTFTFEPVEVDNREDGMFYNPYQTVYAATTYNELNAVYNSDSSFQYKVKVVNNSGEEVGTTISLVSEKMTVKKPRNTVSFYNNNISSTEFEWDTVRNGFYYIVDGEFDFLEVFKNGDTIQRTIRWNNMIITNNNNRTGSTISRKLPSKNFFSFLLAEVPHDDKSIEESVEKRRIGDFSLVFKIAGEDFYEYIASSASGGLNQDIPNFSNVENGLGLITSRITHKHKFILSDAATKAPLLNDLEYDHLKFKSFQ
ncbi:hypothetical protein LJC30_02765 [Odoribacter sp. OttesenSCG-928-L07]|nr:hypothetical protein [Odoribacter sp. OttesenSCG-928-L07]MDL2238953.1 hypothetical protein [Bacteroidales bacterium OttesenSCG-928-L14]